MPQSVLQVVESVRICISHSWLRIGLYFVIYCVFFLNNYELNLKTNVVQRTDYAPFPKKVTSGCEWASRQKQLNKK